MTKFIKHLLRQFISIACVRYLFLAFGFNVIIEGEMPCDAENIADKERVKWLRNSPKHKQNIKISSGIEQS
jgi:hypothetical protein